MNNQSGNSNRSSAASDSKRSLLLEAREALERILKQSKTSTKSRPRKTEAASAVRDPVLMKINQEQRDSSVLILPQNSFTTPTFTLTDYQLDQVQNQNQMPGIAPVSNGKSATQPRAKKKRRFRNNWTFNGHRCSYCPRIFKYHSLRQFHEARHTRPFKCSLCDKGWPSLTMLQNHMNRAHNDVNPDHGDNSKVGKVYRCDQCPFTAISQPLVTKHKKHHGADSAHRCQDCSCAFTTVMALSRHRNRTHLDRTYEKPTNGTRNFFEKSENQTWECNLCHQSYPYSCITSHRKTRHPEAKPYFCPDCPYETSTPSSIWHHKKSHRIPNYFKCPYCTATHDTLLKTNIHIQAAHRGKSLVPKPTKDKVAEPPKKRYKQNVQYVCIFCPKNFPYESDLRIHMGFHTMSYSCQQCSRRFPNQYRVQYHMRSHIKQTTTVPKRPRRKRGYHHRVGQKPQCKQAVDVNCPVCKATFAGKTRLSVHLKLYHPEFEAFACTECPFRTASQTVFYSHRRSHQSSDIFKCGYCTASFGTAKARERHVDSLHPGMTADLAAETLCPRKASVHPQGYYKIIDNFGEAESDEVKHAEVKCCLCAYVGSSRNAFEVHFKKNHPDQKPYRCAKCSYQCVQYYNFINHEKRHQENGVKCPFCPVSFPNAFVRSLHVRYNHKNLVEGKQTISAATCTAVSAPDTSTTCDDTSTARTTAQFKCSK